MKLTGSLLVAMLGVGASAAPAVPVTYAAMGNGLLYGNPVGSFTYDSADNTFLDVSVWSLDHYRTAASGGSSKNMVAIGLMRSMPSMVFSAPLTDPGGDLTVTGYERGVLTLWGTVERRGEVRCTSVAEPAAPLLLGIGLIAF